MLTLNEELFEDIENSDGLTTIKDLVNYVLENTSLETEDDFIDELYDLAERYNSSSPVSGSWSTETRHEMKAISRHFNIPLEVAKKIMIKILGFPKEEIESLKETFEDKYNNCFVELRDEPIFVDKRKASILRGEDDYGYDEYDLEEDFDDVVGIEIPVLNIDTEEIDSSDTIPEGPEVGEDTGISDLLLTLINSENDTIRDYNTFKANLTSHPEFISVIEDITNEEMNHVGMLQTLLKQISPNVDTIKEGEIEAEEMLKDENKEEIIIEPTPDIDLTTDLVDDVDDDFLALYIPEAISESNYTPFNGWDEEDIIKHQSIDWANRNYKDYEDDSEEFKSEVVAYGFGKPIKKIVTMHKFFRANPIYPPYYKAVEEPFEGVVGPMYDGNKHGNYDIHDRYETQDVYDMLSN